MNKVSDKLLLSNTRISITKGKSLTSIIKTISTKKYYNYIINTFFGNKDLEKISIPININNSILLEIHNFDPSMSGVFFDYLSRRIISEIINEQFSDTRAELMLSRKTLSFEVLSDNGKKIFTKKKCYETVTNMQNKTEDIVEEIFIVSLSHTELFTEKIDGKKITKFINKLNTEKNKIKKFIREYAIFYGKIINEYWNGSVFLNMNVGDNLIYADCDLIIGDTLFDFKCIRHKSRYYELLQLISYALLLKKNKKKIMKKISIINPIMCVCEFYTLNNFCDNDEMINNFYSFLLNTNIV